MVVFPEYFTVQLLTLGNVKRPIKEQIDDLANQVPKYIEAFSSLAKEHKIHIIGGTIPVKDPSGLIMNRCYLFGPTGTVGTQDKLHMTRFEKEEWMISPGSGLKVFDMGVGKIAVAICYDVEFPE